MVHRSVKSLFVVAGEASGDLLASRVVRILKKRDRHLKVFGLGGPALAAAGMDVREDLTKQALIGFVEIIKHLPQIMERFAQCDKWFREERPDLVLLTDYPGFNLRLARKAHALGIPVCYYVAPQAWAWHEGRVKDMRRTLSKLIVLFPFEEPWFRERGVNAVYAGHPLAGVLKPVKPKPMGRSPRICVMPGSRRGEVERLWPVMLRASRLILREFPGARFVVPRPATLPPDLYAGLTPEDPVSFVGSSDLRARGACHFAWVKSGTSTVEAALLGTPHVIVYRVTPLSYAIARTLVRLEYVGMVNLVNGRPVVPELLQENATPEKLASETCAILRSPERIKDQLTTFRAFRGQLSSPPHASENAARIVGGMLR